MSSGPLGAWHTLGDGTLCYRLETGIAIVNPTSFELVVFTGIEGNYRRYMRTGVDLAQAKRLAERRLELPKDSGEAFDAVIGDSLVDPGTSGVGSG